MGRQFSTTPNWVKWSLIILCTILSACFIYGILLYNDIEKSKTIGFAETKEHVLRETEFIKINAMDRFHGKDVYHIVFGTTKDKEEKIAFIPVKDPKKDLTIINQAEITSKQRIQNEWQKQCKKCELIKITPAMVNNEPLWEVTYIDDLSRYVLEYLSIYDGSPYEKLSFKQMFK